MYRTSTVIKKNKLIHIQTSCAYVKIRRVNNFDEINGTKVTLAVDI